MVWKREKKVGFGSRRASKSVPKGGQVLYVPPGAGRSFREGAAYGLLFLWLGGEVLQEELEL